MNEYSFRQEPFRLFGVPNFEKTGKLERVPQKLREELPSLSFLGRRCPGARVCFRTDSTKVKVKLVFETLSIDVGMSIYSCQSAYVFVGPRPTARYAGLVRPANYETKVAENTFSKSSEVEDVTIYLPRNEILSDIVIGLDDGCQLLPPTPYKHSVPILYYGSSITEGGCCSKASNAYNALISRWLDVDYYNFGFSGNARGELAMADYINTIDMSIFVMDYDHNAPTVQHLRDTHEPFFKRIREKNPDLPVVFMSRPVYYANEDNIARREVIFRTYQNALAEGDQNVYFVDGFTFFPEEERFACANDNVHPNDLGFYRMAQKICPVIDHILNQK